MKKNKILLNLICIASVVGCGVYCFFQWTGRDSQSPVFKVEEETITMNVSDYKNNKARLLEGIQATDNVDGDITSHILVEDVQKTKDENMFMITYIVFDSSNNMASTQRNLRLTDYYPTQIYCDSTLSFSEGSEVDFSKYITALDAIDGDVSSQIVYDVPSTFTSENAKVGIYECHATTLNSVMDKSELTFNVEIRPNENVEQAPKISLSTNTIHLNKDGGFDPNQYVIGVQENGVLYQIDRGNYYVYSEEVQEYVPIDDIYLSEIDPGALVCEKVVAQEPGNWVNIRAVTFESDLNITEPGTYSGVFTYTSLTTGQSGSVTIRIVVE